MILRLYKGLCELNKGFGTFLSVNANFYYLCGAFYDHDEFFDLAFIKKGLRLRFLVVVVCFKIKIEPQLPFYDQAPFIGQCDTF